MSTLTARSAPVLDFSGFRTAVNDSFVPLRVTSDHESTFRGRIRHAASSDLHVSVVEAGEHVVERTPALIASRPREYLKASLQLSGTGLLVQGTREVVLRPGALTLYDTDRPYSLAFDGDFCSLVLMFPTRMLDVPTDSVGELTATGLHEAGEAAEIVLPFLRALTRHPDAVAGAPGARLARNTVDLLATLMMQQLSARSEADDPRQALFADVLRYIDDHLSAPQLDPGRIAAAHFISPRALHGLFREHGMTVAARVRRRRLDRAHACLSDPARSARSVMSIAIECGFTDPAHFSRTYRAEFGCSPSTTRAAHHHRTPSPKEKPHEQL